jgi:hypothetical protein
VLAAVLACGVVLGAGPAAAAVLLPDEATDLAAQLAAARTRQGVCYGWNVRVADQETGTVETSVGSDAGGGRAVDTTCPRWVEFRAAVTFTAESSESEDSVGFEVSGNFTERPTEEDLRRLGLLDESAFTGEDNDDAIRDAVAALPLLAAEKGAAPPVPLAPNTSPVPASDRATDPPGNDFGRTYGGYVALVVLLVVGGGLWLGVAWWLVPRPDPVPAPAGQPPPHAWPGPPAEAERPSDTAQQSDAQQGPVRRGATGQPAADEKPRDQQD